ncbi:hypothetical protein B0H14DRAFT_3421051 [Mycena olivaceomarginata]|nr:hypothetical protein B0H14DRAFT_3421051 [Mycena olivaceomarginata]
MTKFTFRAYAPHAEPTEPLPNNSEPVADRSGPITPSSTVFRSYFPSTTLGEPAIFSHVVPPAQSSTIQFKTFTPPPVVPKSARPDARTSKKPRLSPSTSASQDAENLDLDDFDDLTTPDLSPPPTSAVVSPQDAAALPPVGPLASTDAEAQMELMNILARYNTMFPADVPQRTSYYRENTCVVPATAHLPTSTSSYYRTR